MSHQPRTFLPETDPSAGDSAEPLAATKRASEEKTSWRGPIEAFFARIRQHRALAVITLLIAIGLGFALVSQLAPGNDTTALSVENASPNGAKAAASILRSHGVDVQQTDSLDSTLSALNRDAGQSEQRRRTLLLYDPNGFLEDGQLQELLDSADRLVVVTPHFHTLRGLGNEIRPAGVVPSSIGTLDPGCGVADAIAAGAISAESAYVYTGTTVCYRTDGTDGGAYAATSDGRLIVLGSTGIISNTLLDENGNAALVLRTLGSDNKLIWYLPGIADIPASDSAPTLNDLAPDWVGFLGPWLALVAVLSMVWRGRRLGPLVREPLPVVVKAVETAEGRARLYHDARALGHASESLRAGTLVRLAKSLRLGADVEADGIVEATARYLGQSREQTAQLLNARPRNETQLVQLAQELERLEKEVASR
jgi:hypothetical protein